MNLDKCPYFYFICVLVLLLLFPANGICGDKEEKYKPDKALVQASYKKAKELGLDPLPMCVGKDESREVFFDGAIAHIVKADIGPDFPAPLENGMVINVGEILLPIHNLKLMKGEYAVVKNGKFIKQPGKITTK
jgi:hypothetical protein